MSFILPQFSIKLFVMSFCRVGDNYRKRNVMQKCGIIKDAGKNFSDQKIYCKKHINVQSHQLTALGCSRPKEQHPD